MNVELVDDVIKNFTRVTLDDFEYLVSLIYPKIKRMDTDTREAMFFDCGNLFLWRSTKS